MSSARGGTGGSVRGPSAGSAARRHNLSKARWRGSQGARRAVPPPCEHHDPPERCRYARRDTPCGPMKGNTAVVDDALVHGVRVVIAARNSPALQPAICAVDERNHVRRVAADQSVTCPTGGMRAAYAGQLRFESRCQAWGPGSHSRAPSPSLAGRRAPEHLPVSKNHDARPQNLFSREGGQTDVRADACPAPREVTRYDRGRDSRPDATPRPGTLPAFRVERFTVLSSRISNVGANPRNWGASHS